MSIASFGKNIVLWFTIACLLTAPLQAAQDAEKGQDKSNTTHKTTERKATRVETKTGDGAPELTEEASKAIDNGLKYLLSIQKKDGAWDDGRGNFTTACTSLALMAFMVKGEFPGYGPNADALDRAKVWLLKQAKSVADGYLGKSMYEQRRHRRRGYSESTGGGC